MSSELVDRLRASDGYRVFTASDGWPAIAADTGLMQEAADRIEHLEDEAAKRRALVVEFSERVFAAHDHIELEELDDPDRLADLRARLGSEPGQTLTFVRSHAIYRWLAEWLPGGQSPRPEGRGLDER
jgi:hypothetical protein